ncbi:hypothetical protein [Streptomyces sp. WZ.A104]|nr:hypothetical protein [Streptomyces sp. WZ.A104]
MELLGSTTGVDLASLLENLKNRTTTVPAPATPPDAPASAANGETEIKG